MPALRQTSATGMPSAPGGEHSPSGLRKTEMPSWPRSSQPANRRRTPQPKTIQSCGLRAVRFDNKYLFGPLEVHRNQDLFTGCDDNNAKSFDTISRTSSINAIFGFQPNLSYAFVASPNKTSTSVGRK